MLESPRFFSVPKAWSRPLLMIVALSSAFSSVSCSCEESGPQLPDAELQDPVTGLTPAEAKEVLVTVGERKITLGDYAATLMRMDEYQRLRYQTEESQKELLDEIIEVELLAQEAKRRGLDKDPQVQLHFQQALRDELFRQLENKLPALEEFSEREVREYYESHRAEFKEPERRRLQVIRVAKAKVAEEVLEALGDDPSGEKWGAVARKYSLERKNLGKDEATELAGDMGFVSAPGEKRGTNEMVPDALRPAVFDLDEVGDLGSGALEAEGFFYIYRLAGISPARDRSVKEAERGIRVELRRQKFLQAEEKLEAELRKKYPVVIDEERIRAFQAPQETSPSP